MLTVMGPQCYERRERIGVVEGALMVACEVALSKAHEPELEGSETTRWRRRRQKSAPFSLEQRVERLRFTQEIQILPLWLCLDHEVCVNRLKRFLI